MTARRVVVTGMGMLTALGNDVPSTWDGLLAGRPGIKTIEAFDPSRLTAQIAGEVRGFDASHVLDRKDQRRTDRYIQFGLVAAREAMDQAELPARLEGELAERTGRHPRDRARRRRDAERRVLDQRPARPRPDQPVPDPDGHPERGRGADRHHLRHDRTQLRDGVRVCDGWPRGRRVVRDHPPRRRRHHARGRFGGVHLRGPHRRVRGDAGALDTERRPGGGVAPLRYGPRWLRGRRGRRRPRAGGARARARPRRHPARRAGRVRSDRRRVPHHAAGTGRDGSGPRGETRLREGRGWTRGGPARQCPCHLDPRG